LRISSKISANEVWSSISEPNFEYITEIIYTYFVDKYIPDYLNKNYINLTIEEKNIILNKIKKIINKNILLNNVLKRIELKEILDIEGIINFRFNDYKEKIQAKAEEELFKLICMYEYEEYIDLLKFYIETQDCKCETLNIFFNSDDYAKLEKKGSVGSSGNFENDSMIESDYLVSLILELAPKKLVIHGINFCSNKNLLRTLNKLYRNKISYCMGCSKCFNNNNLK
jgi:hypothetical protein